jgi:hypothetical protein
MASSAVSRPLPAAAGGVPWAIQTVGAGEDESGAQERVAQPRSGEPAVDEVLGGDRQVQSGRVVVRVGCEVV